MLGWSEQSLEQIGERRRGHGQEPGGADTHLPAGEITEPESSGEIGGEVGRVQVERQCGPGAPPLARLHMDGPHLVANLGAGVWFGYLAGRQMGPGTAWLLTVTGAALANLLEGLLGPPDHLAVGASTAVFAALGAMSAYSWRERYRFPQRWARRWGPLIAGVILLGWTGSAGEGTDVDVTAHLGGFAVGVLLGATAALPACRQVLRRVPQWLPGAAALASVAIAWARALAS